MNNPLRILQILDGHLAAATELILFGKAAVVLGFPNSPAGSKGTLDVDAIIPTRELEAINRNDQLWKAIETTNLQLEAEGLYITHLFEETQTILTHNWLENTVPLKAAGIAKLQLKRPSTIDLILTKMTRADQQDLEDIEFLIKSDQVSPQSMLAACAAARVPKLEEIQEIFEKAKPLVEQIAISCGEQRGRKRSGDDRPRALPVLLSSS
jgi:hypothetical protein